ncbi:MAG: hypothetical protein ACKPKO_22150, partial [Candidatus Fonsibacter sp.]
VRNLARIKRYCESNPDKIVVATGDTDQLECIDCITNQNNYDEYYNRCVDMIFTVGMFLKENNRLNSKKDKRRSRGSSGASSTREYPSPRPSANTSIRSRTSIQSTT